MIALRCVRKVGDQYRVYFKLRDVIRCGAVHDGSLVLGRSPVQPKIGIVRDAAQFVW